MPGADFIRIEADKIRSLEIEALVDTGATMLVLPAQVVAKLGLLPDGYRKVRYADGRRAQRRKAEGAYVELLGRHDTFTAVVEPKRTSALKLPTSTGGHPRSSPTRMGTRRWL